jgi:hypothetical protein
VPVYLFVFDGPPQVLDEDVVAPSPLAVHTDLDLMCRQRLDELGRGELAALIGVEYLGPAVTRQRLFASMIDTRHDSTRRVNQSSTAAR